MGSCDFLCWLWAQVLSKKVVQNRRFKQGVKSSGMERSNAKTSEPSVQNRYGTLFIAAAATQIMALRKERRMSPEMPWMLLDSGTRRQAI